MLLAFTRLLESTKLAAWQGSGPAGSSALHFPQLRDADALHVCALQGAQLAPCITASAPPAPRASLSISCRRAERHAAAGRAVPARQMAPVAGGAALSPDAGGPGPSALMHSAASRLINLESLLHTETDHCIHTPCWASLSVEGQFVESCLFEMLLSH